jgi:hypothetical protein
MKISVTLFLIALYILPINAQSWELRKNKDGIKIYTRVNSETQASEFKAEALMDIPLEKILSVLKDPTNYNKWMSDLKYAKTIKTVNDNKWYTYYIAEVPWPLEDRDLVYLINLKNEPGKITMSLNSNPEFIPESKDYVRMKVAYGKWILTEKGENKTHVYYHLYAEPEIDVPLWIMNMFIVDGPFETLRDLRAYAKSK